MNPLVFERLLRTYMERARGGAWSAPLGTLTLAFLCWDAAGPRNTLIWLTLVSIPDLLTFVHASLFLRRRPHGDAGKPWLHRQVALHALAGLVWGSSVWLLQSPLDHNAILTLPLAWLIGATALGVSSVCEFRRSALLYIAMVWLPTGMTFASRGTLRDWQAIGGIAALGALCMQYAEATRAQSIEAIENGLRLEAASAELEEARGTLAAVNQILQDRNTALQQAVQRISDLAGTDELTALANRREGLLRLQEAYALGQRHQQPASLLFCDLDHFKRINDAHGHAVGDQVLVALAERLRAALRGTDLPIRWGGEEFLVLLRNTDANAAVLAAERVRAAVAAKPAHAGGLRLPFTLSVGVATLQPSESLDGWVDRADAACYAAKAAGRDRVQLG